MNRIKPEFNFNKENIEGSIQPGGSCMTGFPIHTPLENLLASGPGYIIKDMSIARVNIKGNRRTDSQECPVILLKNKRTDQYALCVKREVLSGELSYEIYPIANPEELLSVQGTLLNPSS